VKANAIDGKLQELRTSVIVQIEEEKR